MKRLIYMTGRLEEKKKDNVQGRSDSCGGMEMMREEEEGDNDVERKRRKSDNEREE